MSIYLAATFMIKNFEQFILRPFRRGATTLSITTLRITTLKITILRITTFGITINKS
jgi:hypothetical protein